MKVNEFVIAWLPTTWYIGTLLGSFVFGVIGDRCGRRMGIILSALIAVRYYLKLSPLSPSLQLSRQMFGFSWSSERL